MQRCTERGKANPYLLFEAIIRLFIDFGNAKKPAAKHFRGSLCMCVFTFLHFLFRFLAGFGPFPVVFCCCYCSPTWNESDCFKTLCGFSFAIVGYHPCSKIIHYWNREHTSKIELNPEKVLFWFIEQQHQQIQNASFRNKIAKSVSGSFFICPLCLPECVFSLLLLCNPHFLPYLNWPSGNFQLLFYDFHTCEYFEYILL